MKGLVACLVLLLVLLQARLWFGEGSVQEVWRLRELSRAERAELLRLRGRNRALQAEVRDLKSGLAAIEERARSDLGMIDEGETFYRFVREKRKAVQRTGDGAGEGRPRGAPERGGDVDGRAPETSRGPVLADSVEEPPILHDLGEPTGGEAIVREESGSGG